MRFLRTNTAARVTVGPFFDKSDGVTPEVALTVTAIKLTFMVDDANVPTLVLDTNPTASGGNNDMVHVTGDDAGFYDLELTAANTNFLGRAMLALTDAANHCPVFHEFMILPAMIYDSLVLGTDRLDANVTHIADTSQTARDIGASVLLAADQAVNATKIGGTTQTGRDLGASVLLSPGTGTGQVDLSSGKVLLQATQTGVTIPTVTTLTNAPSDSAGVTTLLSRLSVLRAGYLDNLSAGAAALESSLQALITTVGVAGAGLTATASAVWSVATRLLTAGTNIVLAKGTGVTGFNDLSAAAVNAEVDTALADYDAPTHAEMTAELATADDATLAAIAGLNNLSQANVRSAVGLASANLDTQLTAIDDFLDTEVAAIKAKTDNLPASPAATSDIPTVLEIVEGMFLQDSGQTYADAIAGSAVKEIADNAGGSGGPSAADIADAVWDEDATTHTAPNTAGDRVNSILTNTVSIKTKTDNLPADPAGNSNIVNAFSAIISKPISVNPRPEIIFLDPGGDAVGAVGYFNVIPPLTGSLVSYDTTQKKVGAGSYRFEVDEGGSEAFAETAAILGAQGHCRISFYFRYDVVPESTTTILQGLDVDQLDLFDLNIVPQGDGVIISIVDDFGTTNLGSIELLPNTWNRVSFSYVERALDDADIKVYVNGAEEISIVGMPSGDTSPPIPYLRYGWVTSPGVDRVCWFDQIYIDAGDDLADPGNVLLAAKLPATAFEDNWNTVGGTGAINERPLDLANFKQHTASSGLRQTYTIENAATGDVNISGATLCGHMGWVWAKKGAGDDGDLPALIVNNVLQPIILSTTAKLFKFPVVSSSYPSHAAGIGMRSNEESADTFLYECGVVVAWLETNFLDKGLRLYEGS